MRAVSPVSRRFRFAAPLGLVFVVLSPWLSAGCSTDDKAVICEALCTCSNNCNDTATDACIKRIADSVALATGLGCNAKTEADTFFTCESERATCVNGNYTNNECATETQAFFACLSAKNCSFVASSQAVDCDS